MNLNKVKLFTGTAYNLVDSLNNYLENKPVNEHIIDIKYSSVIESNKILYSALILLEVDV